MGGCQFQVWRFRRVLWWMWDFHIGRIFDRTYNFSRLQNNATPHHTDRVWKNARFGSKGKCIEMKNLTKAKWKKISWPHCENQSFDVECGGVCVQQLRILELSVFFGWVCVLCVCVFLCHTTPHHNWCEKNARFGSKGKCIEMENPTKAKWRKKISWPHCENQSFNVECGAVRVQ